MEYSKGEFGAGRYGKSSEKVSQPQRRIWSIKSQSWSWHPEIGLHPLREGLPKERQDPCGVCGESENRRDQSRITDHEDHRRTEVLTEGEKYSKL